MKLVQPQKVGNSILAVAVQAGKKRKERTVSGFKKLFLEKNKLFFEGVWFDKGL